MLSHSYRLFASTTGDIVSDLEVSDPAAADNFDLPQSTFGVSPPSEDYLPIESDLAAHAVEVNFATCIA